MKRICQIVLALCLPLVLCGPVRAQQSAPYLGAFIGGNALMPAEGSDNKGSFALEFNPALQWGAVAGWEFPPDHPVGEGRIEIEYTRRSNQLDKMKFAEGSFKGGGDITVDSVMLNCFGIFSGDRFWSPYAGVGIGAARMVASGFEVAGRGMGSGSSVVFAYQLGAGLDIALIENLSLDLGYRFFSSMKPTFKEVNGHAFKMDYFSHNVIAGLRVGF